MASDPHLLETLIDRRLIQAVEYVRGRGAATEADLWSNVARYINGASPEECCRRYTQLMTERKYTPLETRVSLPLEDELIQVTVIEGQEREVLSISRRVLVENTRYFRDLLLNREPGAVELSIHSDIAVFKWLIAYCYYATYPAEHSRVTLTTRLVFPILMSAHFLGMSKLVTEAVQFILTGDNLRAVFQLNYDFSCMDAPLLTRFLEMAPLPFLTRYLGTGYQNYLVLKLANASVNSLITKYSAHLFRCTACHMYCLKSILSDSKLAMEHPSSAYLICRPQSMQSAGRRPPSSTTGSHRFRPVPGFSKAIQRDVMRLSGKARVDSVEIYWFLFSYLFWCNCSECNQVFPLARIYDCPSPNASGKHSIERIIYAPSDADLRLTLLTDIFDIKADMWNSLQIKTKLFNFLDVPVILQLLSQRPTISSEDSVMESTPSGQDTLKELGAELAPEEDNSFEVEEPVKRLRHVVCPQLAPSEVKTIPEVETVSGDRTSDPSVSDSQDSADLNEFQAQIYHKAPDEEPYVRPGRLPERLRRYLKLKGTMTDLQRKNILIDISHDDEVARGKQLVAALLAARDRDNLKRPRFAFESQPFPTYNYQRSGKH